MKKTRFLIMNFALFGIIPGVSGAAGTYYNTGLYQRYGTNNASYNASGRSYAARYGQQQTRVQTVQQPTIQMQPGKKTTNSSAKKQGFVANAGLSHEFASWRFDMNSAGSQLHYDDLMWNVLDGNLAYYFGDSTPMQIKVGARYGMQFGESTMIDDDISNGGYLVTTWVDASGGVLGYQTGHALASGTSKNGKQMGFNAAFGLTDFFKWGRVKMTPSAGYRYLKYKLKTENGRGLTMDIFEPTDSHTYVTCVSGYMGEILCPPIVIFEGNNGDGTPTEYTITGFVQAGDTLIAMPSNTVMSNVEGVSTGNSWYYEQGGTTHEYTTTWAGPYLAMDMEYDIDNKNVVFGGIELGLPYYTSQGDQPYRYDWQHPTSVEDTGDFGDAIHLGLNALWKTSITDSTMFTLGFTYDYYKVSNATAKTFLNGTYYTGLYNDYQSMLNDDTLSEDQQAAIQQEMNVIDDYRASGWVLEAPNEIQSVYKSMGIRLGVEMKF